MTLDLPEGNASQRSNVRERREGLELRVKMPNVMRGIIAGKEGWPTMMPYLMPCVELFRGRREGLEPGLVKGSKDALYNYYCQQMV